jgi:spermidine/putrescine-binding protein
MDLRWRRHFLVLIGMLFFAGGDGFAQTYTNVPVTPITAPPPQPTPSPTSFTTGGALHILAPAGHFSDWLRTDLEQKLKAKIEIQTYATPEEAQAALTAPNAHFDLALVVDRIIPALLQANTLRPLPVTQGVRPDHVYMGHYFDRENRFVLPYAWNLLEIAYNSTVVKDPPPHWIDLSSPSLAKHTFFADAATVKRLNEKARQWAELKRLPGAEGTFQSLPTKAEATVQVDGYGALRQAFSSQVNWKYVLPEEGSIILLYHLALPVSGTNPAVADSAVALFMDPANTARLTSENGLAVTQKEALPLVPPTQAHDPLLYPSISVMSKCAFAKP